MAKKQRQHVYRLQVDYEKLGIKGFVIIDSLVNGLCAGGLRLREGLTEDEVCRLARVMTHKFAASGIPIGGAKAGIALDPRHPEKNAVIEKFAKVIRPILSEKYLVGEDMGTTRADIANFYKAAEVDPIAVAKKRMSEKGITLDLPDGFDMLSDESDLEGLMTGHGVAECTEKACAQLGLDIDGVKVAIQGFGSVGSGTARCLAEKGAKIVAVSDVEGTISNHKGLPVDKLEAARDKLGTIDRKKLDFVFAEKPGKAWMSQGAQVLIPAAVADTITMDNVEHVTAQLVVEAANIPVTLDAERQLHRMGVVAVPDFIANAGAACGFGLLLSGQISLDAEEVLREIGKRIKGTTANVIAGGRDLNLLPRKAAENLAETELKRIKKVFG